MEDSFAGFVVRDQTGVEEGISEEGILSGGPSWRGECLYGGVGRLQLLLEPVDGLVQGGRLYPRHCTTSQLHYLVVCLSPRGPG